MGKNRIWYNEKMYKSKLQEFDEHYNSFDKDFFINLAKTCDLKTFRLLCNAVSKESSVFKYAKYEDLKLIIAACNDRVNEILGEYADLYDKLIESQKHELWGGDERYKLFGYDLAPYNDRSIMKTIVQLVCEYINKPLTIENISKISYLYRCSPYWTLVPEIPYNVATEWETKDEDFIIKNKNRQEECEAWYTFMEYVYNGEYDKAYSIMKQCD